MKRWLLAGLTVIALISVSGGVAASPTPYGTWKDRLSLDEMYDGGFDPRLAGTYKLVLAKNGVARYYNSFDGWSDGTFTVSENRIVFADDRGCREGGHTTKKGFYRFLVKNGKLKLTARRGDPCGGRWQTLTYPTWTRVGKETP
jgi:hypothetical protein